MTDLPANHEYEIFAVTLLLCTPSAISRAWTNSDTLDAALAELEKLPLSDDMKAHAKQFMQNRKSMRAFFKGIADVQADVYAGPEPHPGGVQAAKLIQALQALDNGGSRR